MTDRELLESAAKAAGIDAEVHSELGLGSDGLWLKGARTPDNHKYWNPLTDDGAALRLLVALRLDMCFEKLRTVAVYTTDDVWHTEYSDDGMGADIAEKTRRAIVRAAAAMATKV